MRKREMLNFHKVTVDQKKLNDQALSYWILIIIKGSQNE